MIQPYGEGKLGLMVIGEAPGEEEDKTGRPWQGRMGRFLQQTYKKFGIDLFKDAVCVNAINCRPTDEHGNNREPTNWEISCCRPKVWAALEKYKPKVIIAHGEAALTSLIGHRWREALGGITKWRGWTIPDRELNAWVCPTFHPSFVQRSKDEDGDTEILVIWEEDIRRALSLLRKPVPKFVDEREQVEIVEDEREIRSLLKRFRKKEAISIDIEATGIKPYNTKVHRIACIALCGDTDRSYVFPAPEDSKTIQLLKELLEDPDVGKIAANMKYEHVWLETIYGINVQSWLFDTVLAAHILDNRQAITGLKFQAYVHFGLVGYDEQIAPFLQAKDANSVNRVMDLMRDRKMRRELMLYCGVDALVTRRLAEIQMRQIMGGTGNSELLYQEALKIVRGWR